MTRRISITFLIISFAAMGLAAQQTGSEAQKPATPPAAAPAEPVHTFTLTEADKARKNPVRFTDLSVESGKKLYATQCAMCHGDKGAGDGDLAKDMNLSLKDFSKPEVLGQYADGELFSMIGQGLSPMPGQDKRLKPEQIWDLVNYLRSLQGKTPAKATAEELEKAKEAHTVEVHH
jgi:mono/diheme cytochrome c family protein